MTLAEDLQYLVNILGDDIKKLKYNEEHLLYRQSVLRERWDSLGENDAADDVGFSYIEVMSERVCTQAQRETLSRLQAILERLIRENS